LPPGREFADSISCYRKANPQDGSVSGYNWDAGLIVHRPVFFLEPISRVLDDRLATARRSPDDAWLVDGSGRRAAILRWRPAMSDEDA
jgi:hypothetical protein